jgi:hypothetical protein
MDRLEPRQKWGKIEQETRCFKNEHNPDGRISQGISDFLYQIEGFA